jgi:uncharacterized coiled-coil DUF342 family protein
VKRVRKLVEKMAKELAVSEDALWEFIERDLQQTYNDHVEVPKAQLKTLNKRVQTLSVHAMELHASLAGKEAAIKVLTQKIDKARVEIVEKTEKIGGLTSELEALQLQLKEIREVHSVQNQAVRVASFDLSQEKHEIRSATSVSFKLIRITLLLFTLLGVALAFFFIKR